MLPNQLDEPLIKSTALPNALQGAAFVTSKGQVCRLFDDEESGQLATFCPPEEAASGISLTAFDELLSDSTTSSNKSGNNAVERTITPHTKTPQAAPLTAQRSIPVLQIFDDVGAEDCFPPAEKPEKKPEVFDEEPEPVIIPFVKKESAKKERKPANPVGIVSPVSPVSIVPPAGTVSPDSVPDNVPVGNTAPVTEPQMTWAWSEKLKSLNETAASQIQSLADHLIVQMNQGIRTIVFTGFLKGDGCTTLLLCAARELTNRGHKILLGDANRKNPELRQLLSVPEKTPQQTAAMKLSDNLTLAVWNDSAGLSETGFSAVLCSEKQHCDLILLDGGSLTEYPLTEHIDLWQSAASDGNVVVLNTKNTPESVIASIARRFREHNVPLLGVAENCV